MLKRMAVWLIETCCVILGLALLLTALAWASGNTEQTNISFVQDLRFAAGGVILFMVVSGYVMTTFLFGVGLRGQRWWLYPAVAALLFTIHYWLFWSLGASGWDPTTHLWVQLGGLCIVFGCTLAGNWLLQKWA